MNAVGGDAAPQGAGRDHGAVQQPAARRANGRPALQRVLVVAGPGVVTALTDEGSRVDSLRVAWQLDEFAVALAAETAAEVRVLDENEPGQLGPDTAVLGTASAVRTMSSGPGGPIVIELGVGSSTGLRDVEEAGLAGGVDFEAYRAWQSDRRANDRMFGRIDVAEHMGAHIALHSGAYCSFWLEGTASLPRLVARYLEAYATLVGPT